MEVNNYYLNEIIHMARLDLIIGGILNDFKVIQQNLNDLYEQHHRFKDRFQGKLREPCLNDLKVHLYVRNLFSNNFLVHQKSLHLVSQIKYLLEYAHLHLFLYINLLHIQFHQKNLY